MKKIIILLIILNISSCGSNIEKRGYLFNDNMQQDIVSGMQKFEILQLMGSPSTTSSENGDKFYYIANKFYKYAFLNPKEIERTVIVISFNNEDNVDNIEKYTLKDGKIVNYKSDKTIPGGTQVTVIQDLLDNTGRYTSNTAIAGSIF
ncbi:MAG: outer membrane protein assembly factor BamE [Hyphomicrobiales bacterium]|jgi:outer membrane protein assembly factor BamE (lipoprotein component of BamABCDE complex)|nr:outer membrane protein assembly factor BamE [Hyphomicrobiales bacterium]